MFTHTLRDRHDSPRYNKTTNTLTNNRANHTSNTFQ